MYARGLFTAVLLAVSACPAGQPAPIADKPVTPIATPQQVIYTTPDAALPVIVGARCSDHEPCGPGLTCDPIPPNGSCTAPCSTPGSPCGSDGTCVEFPAANSCRALCRSNADCRADEGYACDPVWQGCVLASSPTIAPRACAPPIGLGRDPLFAPTTELARHSGDPAAIVADDGSVVAMALPADRGTVEVLRIDATGRNDTTADAALGSGQLAIALARDGARLHAAMAAGDRISISSSTDRGRTWAVAKPISDRDCANQPDCTAVAIASGTDPQRRGERVSYVAYPAGGGVRIRASRDDGKTFGGPVTALPGARPALAVGGDGLLHVVALRGSPRGAYGSGDHDVVFAVSGDGGRSFTRPQPISRFGERLPFYFGIPRVEVDSARKWIYVAYTRGGRDGLWDLQLAATKDRGKTWVRARIADDPPCATHLAPQLALDPTSGALHVSWYDSRGNRLAHALCADGLRWCRQVGRINDAPFAGLSLARHGPAAASESHALIVDNQRRLLHAVWSQAVASEAQVEARIFHAKAKLPLR